LVQNFVRGGKTVPQWLQASLAVRLAPQAGQNLACAVTFFAHWGHLFTTTI
jgi:hypothetical protein